MQDENMDIDKLQNVKRLKLLYDIMRDWLVIMPRPFKYKQWYTNTRRLSNNEIIWPDGQCTCTHKYIIGPDGQCTRYKRPCVKLIYLVSISHCDIISYKSIFVT